MDFKVSKWDIHFVHGAVQWNGEVNFYADGTTRYDEPAYPGLYLEEGTYVLDGRSLIYDLIGRSSEDQYVLTGTISGKTMSGTYQDGAYRWSAAVIEE